MAVPLFAGTEYVEARVTLEWRNWLSAELLQGYYADRAFYRIGQQKSIDNPDQARPPRHIPQQPSHSRR